MPSLQSCRWVFTLNGFHPADTPTAWDHVKYCVWQKEKGETTSTQHLQGFVVFTKKHTLRSLKKLNAQVHWEMMKGTVKQNETYCTKEDTRMEGPWTLGEMQGSGRRTDLEEIRLAVKRGDSTAQIADEHFGTWCRNYRAIEVYRNLISTLRSKDTVAWSFWGDQGTGKTTRAIKTAIMYGSYYVKSPGRWWPRYEGQTTVVIDDYKGTMPAGELCRIVGNSYPYQVETKGGHVEFVSRLIIFTSILHPAWWYKTVAWMDGLERRFLGNVYRCDSKYDGEWTDVVGPQPQALTEG